MYLFNIKYFVHISQVKGLKESHIKVYNHHFLSISEISALYFFDFTLAVGSPHLCCPKYLSLTMLMLGVFKISQLSIEFTLGHKNNLKITF